jgi:DNA-binding LacI/PurR family transcriptional regulator
VDGTHKLGSLLPTRTELEAQFGVSRVTVQRAMRLLHRDGFIRMAGRQATYVAAHPPHLCRYALVFREFPSDQHFYWTRYDQLLAAQAAVVSAEGERTICAYYGICEDQHETPAQAELLEAIGMQQFAGLIFVGDPGTEAHPRAAQEAGVPCVAVSDRNRLGMDSVSLDGAGFVQRAVEAMAERGCRGVAVLTHAQQEDEARAIATELDRRGIVTHRHWTQRVDLNTPACAANVIELLMQPGQGERPDGLIVTDDNLVEPALAGLHAAEVRLGTDLEVVAHGNFPRMPGTCGPVRWLGYDVRQILAEAMGQIDARRRGETPVPAVIPARFETELAAVEMPSAATNGAARNDTTRFQRRERALAPTGG